MDPKENTKSGPEQNPAAGAEQKVMQKESPRKCKICGGPNHHGCGCEARQRRTVGMTEPTGPQPAEPTGPQPAEPTGPKQAAEGFENLCVILYDTNNYLKLLASDLITIKKQQLEVGGSLDILSYLSNIDQHLKEIKASLEEIAIKKAS